MRRTQFLCQIRVAHRALLSEVEQRLEPEVGEIEYFVALFHEPNRKQTFGKRRIATKLGSDASEQHGLAATPWGD